MGEVKHTILQEIGHALGLIGHSDGPGDIMHVPHQYGVTELSVRDVETLTTLYRLPSAFDFAAMGEKFQIKPPVTLHRVLDHIEGRSPEEGAVIDFVPPPQPEQPEVLQSQHDILSHMGKFHLATQNIRLNPEVRRMFISGKKPPPPVL
jgi:hypothetical protein